MPKESDHTGLLSEEAKHFAVNQRALLSFSDDEIAQINRMSESELESQIKQAWKDGNNDLSRELHRRKSELHKLRDMPVSLLSKASITTSEEEGSIQVVETSQEKHKELGDFVKSIIYGGLDGIITTFAVVASIHGANLKPTVILVLGFANLAADGMSMGVGDYLSEQAEIDFAASERAREEWEFQCSRESEIDEMIEIYQNEHGVSLEDARLILETMAKYPDLFIDHMMVQELGLNPPDPDANPAMNGLFTLCAFLSFGAVPLLSYLVSASFEVSIILTLTCMALLGAFKARLTESSYLRSMAVTVLNGGLAAGLSYAIGFALAQLIETNNC